MASYSLTRSINKLSGGICNGYISNGFCKNPIIAGMIVTFITLFIIYAFKITNSTKIFVIASLANTCYLFFHAKCLTQSISVGQSSNNLIAEFEGTRISGGNNEFVPSDD